MHTLQLHSCSTASHRCRPCLSFLDEFQNDCEFYSTKPLDLPSPPLI